MPDHFKILVKLEATIRGIDSAESPEAIARIDDLLRVEVRMLCAETGGRNGLSTKAVKLREELPRSEQVHPQPDGHITMNLAALATRSILVEDPGEALGMAYGALGNWARQRQ
jgi:hypothetical protein